jgi:PAS domain S-box-containing protein
MTGGGVVREYGIWAANRITKAQGQRVFPCNVVMANILIVDDDPQTRQLYIALLTPYGHLVREAVDGSDGLSVAQQAMPDLILSDIVMPSMNGYEFVCSLRKLPGLGKIPVIFQSASFLDKEAHALGAKCGVYDFISKPSEPERILETVNRVLRLPTPLAPPARLAPAKDPIPLLIDAFHQKGMELDTAKMRLSALLELGLQMSYCTAPRELLEIAAKAARKITGADYAAIGTLEEGCPEFGSLVTSGMVAATAIKIAKPPVAGSFREIAIEKKLLRFCSREEEQCGLALPPDHPPVHSFLGMPVQTGTRAYGLIYVADKLCGVEFTLEDERLLATIAAKLAIAYENILRYHDIQEQALKLESEIKQRKQAEERFRLLVETAPTGILICNGQACITEANTQLQRMFGYTSEELVGQPVEMLVPEQQRGTHVGHRTSYVNHPRARAMGVGTELHGRRKDGTTFPLEISLGPLVTPEGVWISSTIVDISERKKLEQQLQVSQRLEAVGQLSAGIAHDFNNILTAITGNAKLALADLPADHPAHQNLAEIGKASVRATQLVRQILTFGRQETPKLQVVKLAPLVEEALKLLRAGLRAGIEFRTQLDQELPDVLADATQVCQIVMNLGANAAHAMGKQPTGVLEIRLEQAMADAALFHSNPELHQGQYVRLSIRDSGHGMDKVTMARIFEPFYTTKPQGEGTGLGLSVVHGIVKTHNGAITVSSELGKGTVFQLYLPVTQGAAVEAQAPQAQGELRGHGERVLYVDDEEPLVFLMRHMLERLGYKVTGCADPDKALEMFRSRSDEFDVVVSDLSMPGMSGLDLAREILQIRPGMPMLIASGYIRPEDNEQVRSLGLPDLILKPDTVEQLGKTLHKLFEKREQSESVDQSPEGHTALCRRAASPNG